MKYALCMIMSLVVMLPYPIVAGYEATDPQEERAHSGSENEAYLTSRAEESAHTQDVDDAYTTENQEEIEHFGDVNDAYTTEAAERAERG